MVVIIFLSLKIFIIRLAVGCGIPEHSTKSMLLKIGFPNIQSRACMEY
jgi:hypothetical protein